MKVAIKKNGIQISDGASYRRVWSMSKDGQFSVSSFSSFLQNTGSSGSWPFLWKIEAHPRVLAFAWLALHCSILTLDNLHKRKVTVINACPLCLANEEYVNHLLLNCKVGTLVLSS